MKLVDMLGLEPSTLRYAGSSPALGKRSYVSLSVHW